MTDAQEYAIWWAKRGDSHPTRSPMYIWDDIPLHMRDGLARYILHGDLPGHFLTAVITNDLQKACAHADDINIRCLGDYMKFFYNHAPAGITGSVKKMDDWMQKGGCLKAFETKKETA